MIVNLQFKLIYGNNPCNCVVCIDKSKANFKQENKNASTIIICKIA